MRLAASHVAALSEALAGGLAVRTAGQYGVAWLEGVFGSGGPAPPLDPITGVSEGWVGGWVGGWVLSAAAGRWGHSRA